MTSGGGAGPSSGGPSSSGGGPSSSGLSTPGGIAACAACKYQRRKCATDCPLAPYFPPDQPKRFLNVHRLFGVSSILRILRQVDPDKREDAVKSIVYEADTREKDPVNGCLGIIHLLHNQVNKLRDEVALAREQLYLFEQQHNSSLLQQSSYLHPHAGGQANYHYHHHVQPQTAYASTSHHHGGGQLFHDHGTVPGQHLLTHQDHHNSTRAVAAHATYPDHARYLMSDQADPSPSLHEILGHHNIKVETVADPYSSRSSMEGAGGLRYVSDSGETQFHMHEPQSHKSLGEQCHPQGGGSSYSSSLPGGDHLERRSSASFYNPLSLADSAHHVGPDHLRSVAPLQVLDPLITSHESSHATDPELRNAGVHLSLTNRYSM